MVKILVRLHISSVHNGEKPYKCSICDATFRSKTGSKKHTASVHEGKKQSGLNSHVASFHKEKIL